METTVHHNSYTIESWLSIARPRNNVSQYKVTIDKTEVRFDIEELRKLLEVAELMEAQDYAR